MARSTARHTLGALSFGLILACGGSGGDGSASNPIRGTINTEDFAIATGETRILTSDLRVNASKSIRIDGTLQVPAGMKFELCSNGPTTINGSIVPAPDQPAGRGDGEGGGSVDGTNVTINGPIKMPGDKGFNCTTTGPGGKLTITVNGSVTAGNGTPGTATQSGGNGGDIEIGTQAAIDKAKAGGRTNAQAFQDIEIES